MHRVFLITVLQHSRPEETSGNLLLVIMRLLLAGAAVYLSGERYLKLVGMMGSMIDEKDITSDQTEMLIIEAAGGSNWASIVDGHLTEQKSSPQLCVVMPRHHISKSEGGSHTPHASPPPRYRVCDFSFLN